MGCCQTVKPSLLTQRPFVDPKFKEIITQSNINPQIPIIGQNQEIQQLCENFTLDQSQIKNTIPQLTGYIPIRGLQQSLSTCLAYNILWLLRVQKRLDEIVLKTFDLKYEHIHIQDEKSQYYLKYLINQYSNIKEYREKFNEQNFELFILAVTFIKNYIHQLHQKLDKKILFDEQGLEKGLLEWQSDSNEYEQILALLSKELKIQITVINVSNKQVKIQGQYQSSNDKIILLVNSGNFYLGLFKGSVLLNEQQLGISEIKQIKGYQQNPQVAQLINQLYDLSSNKRVVEEEFKKFVGKQCSLEQLHAHYCGQNKTEMIKKLPQNLKGYIPIRGDGNCFYTAVGYSYLKLLIEKNKISHLEKNISDVSFEIQYQNFVINVEQGILIKQDFMNQMKVLKDVESLYTKVSDPQNILYGEMVIFIRSYIKHKCLQDSKTLELANAIGINLRTNLITWEEECDMNEAIISLLNQSLQVYLIIYYQIYSGYFY